MKKLFIFILSFILLPFSVSAESKYVVLGDSISTGYGLEKKEEGFSYILADELGYDYETEVLMGAVDGYTTNDVLDFFSSKPKDSKLAKSVKTALKESEVVTITIGGNDLMGVLYSLFIEEIGEENLNTSELQSGILEGKANYILGMLNVINSDPSSHENVKAALEIYEENLSLIFEEIFKINNEIEIIIATQYNPYYAFENSESLSNLYKEFDEAIINLNEIIKNIAEQKGVKVIDVYEHFARNEAPEKLLNATATPANIDYHPNKEGHKVLAYALGGGEMPEAKAEVIKDKENSVTWYIFAAIGVVLIASGAVLSLKGIVRKKQK